MEIIKTALTFYLWSGILIDMIYLMLHFKLGEEDELANSIGIEKALVLTMILWPVFICGAIYGIIDEIFKTLKK